MALWVDDLNYEEESNELNNASYCWGTVNINMFGYGAGLNQSGSETIYSKNHKTGLNSKLSKKAYNGRKLPSKNILLRKVEISRTPAGGFAIKPLGKKIKSGYIPHTKKNSSKAKLIFPSAGQIPMPNGG